MQLHGSIWLVPNYWMLPKALHIDLSFENKLFLHLQILKRIDVFQLGTF